MIFSLTVSHACWRSHITAIPFKNASPGWSVDGEGSSIGDASHLCVCVFDFSQRAKLPLILFCSCWGCLKSNHFPPITPSSPSTPPATIAAFVVWLGLRASLKCVQLLPFPLSPDGGGPAVWVWFRFWAHRLSSDWAFFGFLLSPGVWISTSRTSSLMWGSLRCLLLGVYKYDNLNYSMDGRSRQLIESQLEASEFQVSPWLQNIHLQIPGRMPLITGVRCATRLVNVAPQPCTTECFTSDQTALLRSPDMCGSLKWLWRKKCASPAVAQLPAAQSFLQFSGVAAQSRREKEN